MSLSRFAMSSILALGLGAASLPGVAAACDVFVLPDLFSLKQSTGIPVTVQVAGREGTSFEGSVRWGVQGSGDRGTLSEGFWDGNRLTFTAIWRNSPLARYEGEVTKSGRLRGSVYWGTNNSALYEGIQKLTCAR